MGSAAIQRQYWGKRAADWAEFQEAGVDACYLDALDQFAPLDGVRVLDVACGAGGFVKLAAERGAAAAGIDATPELVGIAEKRVPTAEFRICDMEELPYADGAFDVVTGFNAFQYAADLNAALREAARVVRPGGRVLNMTWGRGDQVEAAAYVGALGTVLPAPSPGARRTFDMGEPGAMEDVMAKAGMEPGQRHEVACPWVYADHDAALRGLLASGPAAKAIEHSGLEAVTAAISRSLELFRRDDGSYLMRNVFHYVVGTVA